jgi:hypothetical protein
MGWDLRLRSAASTGLFFNPGWLWCGPCYDGIFWGKFVNCLPQCSGRHQYSGSPVSRDISWQSRKLGEGNVNLVYPSPWDFKRSLTRRNILRHGTSGFTSHPKERVLIICIALKNLSSGPCSNPRPLGPVPCTLTTTPPGRLNMVLMFRRNKGPELEKVQPEIDFFFLSFIS